MELNCHIPDADHIVVHLLKLLLGHLNGIGRGVQLVSLEALVAQRHREGLIVGLGKSRQLHSHSSGEIQKPPSTAYCSCSPWWREKAHVLTSGTLWLRDDEAALVVTERVAIAKGAGALARRGSARGATRGTRRALENIARSVGASGRLGDDEVDGGDNKHSRSEILRRWGDRASILVETSAKRD